MNLSLRDIAARLVITKDKKKGQHPSAATVLRTLCEHDEPVPPPQRRPPAVLNPLSPLALPLLLKPRDRL